MRKKISYFDAYIIGSRDIKFKIQRYSNSFGIVITDLYNNRVLQFVYNFDIDKFKFSSEIESSGTLVRSIEL